MSVILMSCLVSKFRSLTFSDARYAFKNIYGELTKESVGAEDGRERHLFYLCNYPTLKIELICKKLKVEYTHQLRSVLSCGQGRRRSFEVLLNNMKIYGNRHLLVEFFESFVNSG